MGSFFNKCNRWFGGCVKGRFCNPGGGILIFVVATLLIYLLFCPAFLVFVALLGLFIWALLY